MDVQEGFPKHKLLQDEPETEQEVTTQYTQSTNLDMGNQIKSTIDQSGVDGVNLQQTTVKNDVKQEQQIELTIKQQYGEHRQIRFSEELKQLSIVALKQRVFPEQYAQGYIIRFIYNGILVHDQQLLKDLDCIGNPIIHVQIYPSVPPSTQQHQPQQQIFHVPNQRYQSYLDEDNNNEDPFLIILKFCAAFFIGFVFSFLGLCVICICSESNSTKIGALIGCFISLLLFWHALEHNWDD